MPIPGLSGSLFEWDDLAILRPLLNPFVPFPNTLCYVSVTSSRVVQKTHTIHLRRNPQDC